MPPARLCPPVLVSPPLPCRGPWGERQCALRGLLEPDPQQAPGPSSQHPIVFQVCVMLCDTFFASAWPTGRPPPRAGARPFLSLSRPRAGHRRGAWTPVSREDTGPAPWVLTGGGLERKIRAGPCSRASRTRAWPSQGTPASRHGWWQGSRHWQRPRGHGGWLGNSGGVFHLV